MGVNSNLSTKHGYVNQNKKCKPLWDFTLAKNPKIQQVINNKVIHNYLKY